jgi:hypothetical protein
MTTPISAYVALTNGNIAGLEENVEEYLDVLADENEGEVATEDILEAHRGIVTETLKFLAAQRKLDHYLKDNVAPADSDTVDYSLEVAESLGLTATFGVRVVAVPQEIAYKEALDILFSGE